MYQYQFTVQGASDASWATSILAKSLSAAGEFICDLAGLPMCESSTSLRFQQMCAAGNSSSSTNSNALVCNVPPPPPPLLVGVTVAAEGVNCIVPVPPGMTSDLVTYLQSLVTGVVVTVDGVTCKNEMVSAGIALGVYGKGRRAKLCYAADFVFHMS
jgi:hypothetical protein